MKILITGDQGYIGSALKEYLDHELTGYDLINNQDILDYNNLNNSMKDIDLVIHLAACSTISTCNNDPDLAYKINELGTENVLNAMKANHCSKIIYASTSSVYGAGANLTEESEINCQSVYGASKYAGELKVINSGVNYIIFRMFNVVGQVNSQLFGFDRLFGALISGHVNIYGIDYDTRDGTCERDYISLNDVCLAYKLVIDNIDNQIYNLCSNIPRSVLEIIDEFKKYHFLAVDFTDRRLGDPDIVYGNNSKLKSLLNWDVTDDLEAIVKSIKI
jgi:UDP-glucose 4-epimerase